MTSRLVATLALAALAPCESLLLHTARPVLRPSTAVQLLPVAAAPLIPRAPDVVATAVISEKKPTAVYALILGSFVSFALDNVLRIPLFRSFYLYHSGVRWWQPVTSLFCHGSRSHLSNNLFLLLLFGRSVEDELGWGGLVFTYLFCGVLANLASLALLPAATVSIGASGAVPMVDGAPSGPSTMIGSPSPGATGNNSVAPAGDSGTSGWTIADVRAPASVGAAFLARCFRRLTETL